MTLDKFGRHLGRRTKRIYLIEESGDERIKQAIEQKVQSQLLQITKDFVSQKKLSDAIDHAVSSLQLSSITKDDVRQLCAEEDAKLRCTLYYPFTAFGGAPNLYYIINGTDSYIELWMDCTILDVTVDTPNVDFQIQFAPSSSIISMPLNTLKGMEIRKGGRIYIVRNNIQSFTGSLIFEYVPLKK